MHSLQLRSAHRRLESVAASTSRATRQLRASNAETLVSQLQLACIPAPTGEEQQRGQAVAHAFAACGYDHVHTDSAGNIIAAPAFAASTPAPVVCMAHLDTVFDANTALTPFQQGARVHCPGIGDNSRGLAAMLAFARLVANRPPGEPGLARAIEFVATVGEEGLGNLRGAHAYFANRIAAGHPTPHAVLVLDGPGDQHIVHHALGSRRYRIVFRGAGGHSWADFGTPNAVHAASRTVALLADAPRSFSGRVALTVSAIGGGESMNAIPANAWLDVDVRATDSGLLLQMDAVLRTIVYAAVAAECASAAGLAHVRVRGGGAGITTDVMLLGERPCGALPSEHPLVQLAYAASARSGTEAFSAVASTDANVPLALGIPAIAIGGGGTGGGAHTVNEWYDDTHGARGLARAFAILAALAA